MERKIMIELIQKWEAGKTNLEEERQLAAQLEEKDLPEKFQVYRDLFEEINSSKIALESLKDEGWLDKIIEDSTVDNPNKFPVKWLLIGFLSFSLLMISAYVGWYLGQKKTEPIEMMALQAEMMSIKQVLLKSQVEPLSPTYRIDLVNQIVENPAIDEELLLTLEEIINYDENVNVRIAAIEGLSQYIKQPKVEKILIKSLSKQADSNAQMILIGILTEQKVQNAKPAIEELINKEEVMDFVRKHAASTLKTM